MMASAGGLGSGMATGTASGVLNADSTYDVQIDSAATFNGIGSGNYENAPSQHYSNGFVNGNGSSGGIAVVNGDLTGLDGFLGYGESNSNANVAFNLIGGGSGFAKGQNGGADGSASGGAFGAAAGLIMSDPVRERTYGDLDVSVMSAANGIGAFVGGLSTSGLPGPTGGTGSGDGTLNVVEKTGSGVSNSGLAFISGSAGSIGGGLKAHILL
jgi:hypothetical protein